MNLDRTKIALDTAVEEENELKKELAHVQAYIKRLRFKLGEKLNENSISDEVEGQYVEEAKKLISDSTDVPDGYMTNLSLVKKFILLLKFHKRFLHFKEVADMIIEIEPNIPNQKKLAAKLSAVTSKLKGVHIEKYQEGNDNRQTYWGIKEWLDDNGNIKPGHEYTEGYGRRGGSTADMFDFE
jgi:hypothetical protein